MQAALFGASLVHWLSEDTALTLIDPSNLPPLVSERLSLRRPAHADVDAISVLANNWEIAKWMSRLPFPYRRQDAVFFLEEIVPKEATWAIQAIGDAGIIGVVGLVPHEMAGTVELGYWLGEPYWHRGFASEAAQAVLDYAFGTLGLSEVTSGCFVGNARSARVLEKLGFRTLRTSTRACMAQAKELPHLDMVLARKVWDAKVRSISPAT